MSRKLNHEETTGNAGPASFPQPILVEMDISGPGPEVLPSEKWDPTFKYHFIEP
jgi:hypothetical protein